MNLHGKNQKITSRIKGLLYLSCLCLLVACSKQTNYNHYTYRQYQVTDSAGLNARTDISEFVRPYRDSLKGIMEEVIVYSEGVLSKSTPEGSLGNYCADACMSEMNELSKTKELPVADFCLLNNGGLRNPLPAGAVTLGNVFELMPFDNELVILELDSIKIMEVLNYTAGKKGAPVSGIRFVISEGKAASVETAGSGLNNRRNYMMLTSDYIAGGGDGYSMLKGLPLRSTGIKVRDALILNMKKLNQAGQRIRPYTDGRIREIQP